MDLPVVVDGDLGVDGQAAADLAVGGVQRPGVLREQGGGVAGQPECRQDVVAGRRWSVWAEVPRSGISAVPGLVLTLGLILTGAVMLIMRQAATAAA